mgnify:CR=1 FL=1
MIARPAQMDPARIATLTAVLSFGFATGCHHTLNPSDLETSPMDPQSETVASADTATAPSPASLYADIYYDTATGTVRVRYRVRNASATRGLAVFDRGVYGDWSGVAYAPGPVGTATLQLDGTDAVLLHAPTAPDNPDDLRATPLAIEVAPGGELESMYLHRIDRNADIRRLRWCVAVAPLEPDHFRNPQRSSSGTIWMASADAVQAQTRLCSDWYTIERPDKTD